MRMRAAMTMIASILATGALAAEGERTVDFAADSALAEMQGQLAAGRSATYEVEAAARQVLSIRFTSAQAGCHMNVWPPGADAATHLGAEHGPDFVANLARVGRYRVQAYFSPVVITPDARCDFAIAFHRTAAGAPLPLPSVPQGRDALRGAIDKCLELVGAPAEVVGTRARGQGLFELALRERESGRRSACTVRDDGSIEDWVER